MKRLLRNALLFALIWITMAPSCETSEAEEVIVTDLGATEFKTRLGREKGILIDVRDPDYYSEGHLPGAINIYLSGDDFKHEINGLDKNGTYFVYCDGGALSETAAEYMREVGFQKIYNLERGLTEWKENGYPVIKEEKTEVTNGMIHLSVEVFKAKLESEEGMLIDVRTPEEFSEGHLDGAVNIDLSAADFKQKISSLNRNNTYFVYCKGGARSEIAAEYMQQIGFKKIYNLEKGIMEWQEKGFYVKREKSTI